MTIGSADIADIQVPDDRVEPVHVVVTLEGEEYVAQRLGGPRTMYVGGRSKKTVPISSVTVLRLGGPDGVELVLQPVRVEQPTEPPYVAALLNQQSTMTKRLRRHMLGLVGLLVLVVGVGWFSGPIEDFSRNRQLEPVERATVRLVVPDADGSPLSWGSGTIIDESGLILTNAHVAAPSAPGLQLRYGPEYPRTDPDYLEVWVLEEGADAAVPAYRATPVVADGWLDLAVARIVSDIDGEPIPDGTSFPTADLGGRDGLNRGDTVHVLGYPGIAGGSAQRISSGSVAAWQDDDRLPGSRDVLDTTANITGGNSGGALIDQQGDLVAVPMSRRDDTSGAPVSAGLARPVTFAEPLIERALEGQAQGFASEFVRPPTGRESADLVGWSVWQPDGQCGLPSATPPLDAQRVCAHVEAINMSHGLDLLLELPEMEGEYATTRIDGERQREAVFGLDLAAPLYRDPVVLLHLGGGQEQLELE
ncbi:trypsin-like peptidase domain-containing protein [Nocardioides sp. GCM10028917]|uniref:trypsin-like peptidase domain-containing protein n=1 Tax=Nocardioides sp. GCM10028917 TaxID=3273408 RepID=UPI003619B811